jgi:hypothetical protein
VTVAVTVTVTVTVTVIEPDKNEEIWERVRCGLNVYSLTKLERLKGLKGNVRK